MGVAIKTFKHQTFGTVRCYIDKNGKAHFNAEDIARGLGFVEIEKISATSGGKNSSGSTVYPDNGEIFDTCAETRYSSVRWRRVNKYLKEFGYPKTVNKNSYLPENMVYRLAMKANNENAKNFQGWLADDVVPTIRKTGGYILNPERVNAPLDIVPLTYNGERVLTNRQIAEIFSVTESSIIHNYGRHKSAIAKNIDFYDLRGKAFTDFRAENSVAISRPKVGETFNNSLFDDVLARDDNTEMVIPDREDGTTKTAADYIQGSVLKIWTKSGVFKLSKYIHTDDVEYIYDKLAECYFDVTPEILSESKQLKDNGASVYAFEMSNGTVKIGMSNNVPYRVKAVEYDTHLKVVNSFYVTFDSRKKAFDVETALHKYFETQCAQGEFFLIDFDEACEQIRRFVIEPEVEVQETYPQRKKNSSSELLLEFIKMAQTVNDETLKENIVRETAKLIFGKEF